MGLDDSRGWQAGEKDCWLQIAVSSPANLDKQRDLTLCLVLANEGIGSKLMTLEGNWSSGQFC
jgi:hypothetical protein